MSDKNRLRNLFKTRLIGEKFKWAFPPDALYDYVLENIMVEDLIEQDGSLHGCECTPETDRIAVRFFEWTDPNDIYQEKQDVAVMRCPGCGAWAIDTDF